MLVAKVREKVHKLTEAQRLTFVYMLFATVLTGAIILAWWSGHQRSEAFYAHMEDVHTDLLQNHDHRDKKLNEISHTLKRIEQKLDDATRMRAP